MNWKKVDESKLKKLVDYGPGKGYESYHCGRLTVLKSIDAGRIHMSISHQDRYPTWGEIKEAREQFLPMGKFFAMIIPPTKYYVNMHPNCFHLWELREEDEPHLIWISKQM